MNTPTVAPVHSPSPVEFVPGKHGSLDGFASTCSCGLVMRSIFKMSVEMDIRAHLVYWANRKPAR